jgi:hypothetical protein
MHRDVAAGRYFWYRICFLFFVLAVEDVYSTETCSFIRRSCFLGHLEAHTLNGRKLSDLTEIYSKAAARCLIGPHNRTRFLTLFKGGGTGLNREKCRGFVKGLVIDR